MRNTKRFLSVLLAMVMLLCAVPVMQASALSKTADEAIAWCQSKVGQKLGGQCVELINQYCSYLGTSAPRVNAAKDFATWAPPSGFSKIQNAQPQKGDVLVFTGGQYGHVCIYESDYVTYHQNYNIKYPNCQVERITTYYRNLVSNYWGVLRPEFAASAAGDPIGFVDEISAEGGVVVVSGWVYDPDSPNAPVSIHVYVGGKAGSGAKGYAKDINGNTIKANLYRRDLDRYWGFEARIAVSERRSQNIYVYAINNEGGNNPEIDLTTGVSCTVNISCSEHVWNAGTVTTPATCTKAGVRTYTCTACGATRTETINKLGHTDPDANGKCSRCGVHLQDVTPSDPGASESVCPWCGGTHEGMFGWLVQVFHNIFAAILGARY